jgi:hypothetical protein
VIVQKTEDLAHISILPPQLSTDNKIEIEEYADVQQQEEVFWSPSQDAENYIEDALEPHSSMDVLNKDIKRHRKRRRSEAGSIDVALSSFLIGCNLTFDIVDSKHFKGFVNALNPDYKVPSSAQLTAKVLSQLKGGDGGTRAKKRQYYSSDSDDFE